MIIVQISDPHISNPDCDFEALYNTEKKLKTAISSINRFKPKPDAVVISGDLVNCGDASEYEILKKILEDIEIPVFLGIGNHDCRDTFKENFKDLNYLPKNGFIQYSMEIQGLRMVMLDTNIPNDPKGILCSERLSWLDNTLAEQPQTPTILFMHHPPFKTGMKAMDSMGLLEADAFGKIVEKHDQVIRIFCGHLHRPIQSIFHGKMTQVCPSTSHRVLLHLEVDEKLATTAEPAEMLIHSWDGTNLVTHSMFTEDYPTLWELEGDLY